MRTRARRRASKGLRESPKHSQNGNGGSLRDSQPDRAFTAYLHGTVRIFRKAVPLYCVTPRCARRLVAMDRPQRGDRPALRLVEGSRVSPEGSQ